LEFDLKRPLTPFFFTPDWHLEAGLAVVFAEAPAENRSGPKAQIIKPEWSALCPIYNTLSPDLQ
jgi:iron transport multicopper oxidase